MQKNFYAVNSEKSRNSEVLTNCFKCISHPPTFSHTEAVGSWGVEWFCWCESREAQYHLEACQWKHSENEMWLTYPNKAPDKLMDDKFLCELLSDICLWPGLQKTTICHSTRPSPGLQGVWLLWILLCRCLSMMYHVQNEGASWGSITFLNKATVLKGELLPKLLVSLPEPLDSSSILMLDTDQGSRFPAKWQLPDQHSREAGRGMLTDTVSQERNPNLMWIQQQTCSIFETSGYHDQNTHFCNEDIQPTGWWHGQILSLACQIPTIGPLNLIHTYKSQKGIL